MAKVAVSGHEEIEMTTVARRRKVLLKVSGPNGAASVVALPGSRYFITVVTFTHISGLVVSVTPSGVGSLWF